MSKTSILRMFLGLLCIVAALPADAHHILGKPAYNSGKENSSTPPSMQVETQIGDYLVNFMVFPAFPKPGIQGRLHLYAARLDNGMSFDGKVTFKVRDDKWFSSSAPEVLGTHEIDDKVYRQGVVFSKEGDYIVTAEFQADGQPYIVDMPLRVGEPASVMPIGLAAGVIVLALLAVSIIQRRRLLRLKAVRHHDAVRGEA